MNCQDIEILLAEYVDGTLHGEPRKAVEVHLAGCPACTELARDASEAVAFMERAIEVDPPPEMVNRILFEITSGPSRALVKPPLVRRLFGKWLQPVMQPRFAMGMAMTVLSFGMMFSLSGVRQLKPSDLDPVNVWHAAEDRVVRVWDRGVKYYQSLRLVFEIQTRLKEWSDEQAAADANQPPASNAPAGDSKK
jgi:Putative zinc-finger